MSDSNEDALSEEATVTVPATKKNKRKRKSGQSANGATPEKKNKNESPKKNLKNKNKKPNTPAVCAEDSSDEDAPAPTPKGGQLAPGAIVDLGNECFVRINEFKGKVYVDLRGYYRPKDGSEYRPGNKGIALRPEQWAALKKNIDIIDKALAAKL